MYIYINKCVCVYIKSDSCVVWKMVGSSPCEQPVGSFDVLPRGIGGSNLFLSLSLYPSQTQLYPYIPRSFLIIFSFLLVLFLHTLV